MSSTPTPTPAPASPPAPAAPLDVGAGAQSSEPPGPRSGRVGRGIGVVLVQGLNSVTTVAQMALFAIVLPRHAFDDYSVWVTSGMFLIGLAQAVGTERVVIGKRDAADGVRSARVLAIVVALAQLGISAWLGNLPLVLCSLAMFAYVTYDYQRFVRCFDEARRFLARDLSVLAAQVVVVLGAWAMVGDSRWLVLGWWAVAAPAWFLFSGRDHRGLGAGLAVLRDDARECVPLLLDAALAGVPLVVALALARSQGTVGDASAARMAFTILGPITVLGMSAKRMAYQSVASGPLSTRFAVFWTGVCVATLVGCFGLLTLTRTPLYPWAFPGFASLSWAAIAGFSVNHAAMFSTLLPAAGLRAERRSLAVGLSRVVATLASGVALVVFLPVDTPAKVGWSVALGSIVYTLTLFAARAVPRRGAPVEVVVEVAG